MMGMVVDLESPANDLSDAFPGPQIGRKPGGQGALAEDASERPPLCRGQLGGASGGQLRPQAFEAMASDGGLPSPNRRRRHLQRPNHVDVLLAGQEQSAGSKTSSLLLLFGSESSVHTHSYAATCKTVHYFRDGQ